MPILVVREGVNREKRLPLRLPKGQLFCGTDPKATFRLDDPLVAPKHFRLVKDGDAMTVHELEEGRPLLVNGMPVRGSAPVRLGDSITLGGTTMALEPDEGESLSAAPAPMQIRAEIKQPSARIVPPSATIQPASAPGGLAELQPGQTLGGCVVEERFGSGAIGAVYRARQSSMDRTVAMKVLQPAFAADRNFVSHFLLKCRAAGQHHHPNVIQIYDVGEDQGRAYVCMEHVQPGSLARAMAERGAFSWSEAHRIVKGVAEALRFARTKALVHGSINPDNVLLGDGGRAKLADLGIASLAPATLPVTVHRARYMAPEQFERRAPDARTDIYCLGLVLYRMLAGRVPYDGVEVAQIQRLHADGSLPRLMQFAPELPDEAFAVVEKMLARRPEERYPHAEALLADLERAGESGAANGFARPAPAGVPRSFPGPARAQAPKPARPIAPRIPDGAPAPVRRKRIQDKKDVSEYLFPILLGIGAIIVAVFAATQLKGEIKTDNDLAGAKRTLAQAQMVLADNTNTFLSYVDRYRRALEILETGSRSGRADEVAQIEKMEADMRQAISEDDLYKQLVKEYNEVVDLVKGGQMGAARSQLDSMRAHANSTSPHEGMKMLATNRIPNAYKQLE